jgi:ComF family protein
VVIPRTDYHNIPDNPVAQLLWGRCKVERAAAFSYYNKGSRIRNLIHNIKYKGVKEAGIELGKIYGYSLKSSGFTDGIDFIIPVPLHPSKMRKRGFNQSQIISEGISSATGIPVDNTSLVRASESETQTKRSRYERWINVEGIFVLADREALKGKHVLLIDDVITTGSTIESCANELLKTEEIKVSVAALAYAVM